MSTSEKSSCPFDHHSPEHAANAVEAYRAIREGRGIVRSDRHGGFAAVTRYDDVVGVARDHERYSNAYELEGGFSGGVTLPHNPTAPRMSIAEMDPPDWNPIRRALNPWFSVEAMDRFSPRIREITTESIDRFIESGSCDLVFDLCNPVPAIVTMEYLGIPTDEWERWAVPIHTSVYTPRTPPDNPEISKLNDAFAWIYDQVREIVADRRRTPTGDLVSFLVSDDGAGLDDSLAFEAVYTLLAAGVDTTTSLLSAALHHLAQHPEERQRLVEDRSLLKPACEEFLRYYSPAQATARTVAQDGAELCGEIFNRGDRLLLSWASANRDASHFADPDEFVLDRTPNRHVAFAHGIHRCLGAPLARAEFDVVMDEVLDRLPEYEIDLEGSPTYPDIGLMFGYQHMPATFPPGPRLGSPG